MVKLQSRVTGMEAVRADFDLAAERVRRGLKAAVEDAVVSMEGHVRSNLGGGVLNQRTGRLAASVGSLFRETGSAVYAKVGTDHYIGRFWERGFRGEQTVRAHFRAIKHGNRFELKRVSRRGVVRTTRVYETGAVPVRSFERRVDGAARLWLQPALDAVRERFRQRVKALTGGQLDGR